MLMFLVTAPSASPAAALKVVATLPDLAGLAREVGGSRVEVSCIAKGSQDPHYVDPKPSFMVKLRQADLFLVNGLDLEIGWVPPLLAGAGNPAINVGAAGYVDCSAGVPVLEVPGHELTRADGDIHPFGNPHYLLDPLNGILVARTICEAFKRHDAAGAAAYDANLNAFASKLYEALFGKDLVENVGGTKLDRMARGGELDGFLKSNPELKAGGWLGRMRPLQGQPIVVYHRNYSYFVQRFGIAVAGEVEPKPGIPPSAKHMVEVVAVIKSGNIKVIATQPFFDSRAPDLIASKTGAKVVTLPSSTDQVAGVGTYLELFDASTRSLSEAMK